MNDAWGATVPPLVGDPRKSPLRRAATRLAQERLTPAQNARVVEKTRVRGVEIVRPGSLSSEAPAEAQ